jgi:hypothetical protein
VRASTEPYTGQARKEAEGEAMGMKGTMDIA